MEDVCTIFCFDLLEDPLRMYWSKQEVDTKTITPNTSSSSLDSLNLSNLPNLPNSHPQPSKPSSASPPPALQRAWTVHFPPLRANKKHVPSLLKRADTEQSLQVFYDSNRSPKCEWKYV